MEGGLAMRLVAATLLLSRGRWPDDPVVGVALRGSIGKVEEEGGGMEGALELATKGQLSIVSLR